MTQGACTLYREGHFSQAPLNQSFRSKQNLVDRSVTRLEHNKPRKLFPSLTYRPFDRSTGVENLCTNRLDRFHA